MVLKRYMDMWKYFIQEKRTDRRAQALAIKAANLSIVSLMRKAKEKRQRIEQKKVAEHQMKIQQAAARKVYIYLFLSPSAYHLPPKKIIFVGFGDYT